MVGLPQSLDDGHGSLLDVSSVLKFLGSVVVRCCHLVMPFYRNEIVVGAGLRVKVYSLLLLLLT